MDKNSLSYLKGCRAGIEYSYICQVISLLFSSFIAMISSDKTVWLIVVVQVVLFVFIKTLQKLWQDSDA